MLAGMSAGAICWFESCTTDSFGPTLRPLHGALGFLAGSLSPHYHGEAQRRPLYHRLVGDGTLPPGYAVDDGAALVFRGPRTRRGRHLATRPRAPGGSSPTAPGARSRRALPTRFLGA